MNGPGLQAVRVVGGLVPPGLFAKVHSGELRDPASLSAKSYHLAGRETLRDAANRSWTYLRGAWSTWREHAARTTGAGTSAARDQWLLVLMRELGYGQLPALRGGISLDGAEYPVSHAWQHVPVHLLGPGVDLDRRNPGVSGAARAPQAMIQELLNRSEAHLWALLSNGLRLRLLRDSTALAGSAYAEFDLEAIFDGELFSEFLLMWQVCHESRLEKRGDDAPPTDCWLEAWRSEAVDSGARALRQLRDGIENALEALGSGFLQHPANDWLRAALRSNDLSTDVFHRALLRMAYRLLFLSVAEERDVLHDPAAPAGVREHYARYFSIGRLRKLSRIRSGGPHGDLWGSLKVVLRALGGDGLKELGLPALAGLFDPAAGQTDHLLSCSLANSDLLAAMRALGWVAIKGQRIQPVDYRNLGAEELGSVYESLLELVPRIDLDVLAFRMEHRLAGNERKTSGSYYTPSSLVTALLDSALDPVLDDAVKNARDAREAVSKLLDTTVCDPACGSGSFLIGAARRIARRIAQQRSGEDEPTPEEVRHALHEVVGHCIYGVDVNPMAAELAKVTLWMEAMDPGRPLSFLDARIRVGDSLLGTTPALIAAGVPDGAFQPIEGDDKKLAAGWRKQSAKERNHPTFAEVPPPPNDVLAKKRDEFLHLASKATAVRRQMQRFAEYNSTDEDLLLRREQADAWCAAFVWKVAKDGIDPPTAGAVRGFVSAPDEVDPALRVEVERLADEYRFFHWHLEFPEIFGFSRVDDPKAGPEGWRGGFACLLGNVPWERVKLQEQEFFATRDPEIAQAANKAERTRRIRALLTSDSPGANALHQAYLDAKRHAEGESTLLRSSGRFPLTGRGDVNTYAVFAEIFRSLTGPHGRSGIITPTGIATDATTQFFFKDLVMTRTLASLYDFENEDKIFPEVHNQLRFCLCTTAGKAAQQDEIALAFRLRRPDQIGPHKFTLTPEDITLLNPNTGTCPAFDNRRNAEITIGVYRNANTILWREDPEDNPWDLCFMSMLHMANDSGLFRGRDTLKSEQWSPDGNAFVSNDERMLPLYEGKMPHLYDHRFATYARATQAQLNKGTLPRTSPVEKSAPDFTTQPRYWVDEGEVDKRLARRGWEKGWLLGWRETTTAANERTTIATVIPRTAVGNKYLLALTRQNPALLQANLASIALDFCARQKLVGTSLSYFLIKQLPVLHPSSYEVECPWLRDHLFGEWVTVRVLELTYTAYDIESFARDYGDAGPPFCWDEERRFWLRAELDAAYFHQYGVSRDDVNYVLDSFRAFRNNDRERFARTKKAILEIYAAMSDAVHTGEPYQTILDPPPGQGRRHPAKEVR